MTSEEAGWGRGLLDPSAVRLAPRVGFALALDDSRAVIRGGYGIFLNQWAYSVQTAFARNLPFFYTKQVDVPATVRVPTLETKNILATNATGTIAPTIMDFEYSVEYSQTWSGGLQYELFPSTMVEVSYMGTWTLGADNGTVRNVPEPGAGPIQPRRPIPQLSRINAIRFDGKSIYHGVTFKTERRLANNFALQRQLHAVPFQGRCVEPGRNGIGNEPAAERQQHLRRDRRMGALQLRPSASVHRERHPPAPLLQRSGRRDRGAARRVAGQRHLHRADAARPSRSTSASTGPTSAPDRRSVPISFAIQTCPAASRRRSGGSTRRRSRCRTPSRSAAHRETASSDRATRTSISRSRKPGGCAAPRSSSSDGRSSTC